MSLPDYIFPGAFVTLRGGNKGRIYATDGGGERPVHGATLSAGWYKTAWQIDGLRTVGGGSSCLDIVGPWIDKPDYSKLWPLLPPWIRWVAQDSTRAWFGYENRPAQDSRVYHSKEGICIVIPDDYAPTFSGDWKDSLCERPKS